jgi:hypothetical protein
MTTQDYRAGEGDLAGEGWIAFAAIMLGLAGTWNLLQGLLAVGESRVYVGDSVFVFSDLNTWGWIITILGAVQLVAVLSLVRGGELARWFAVAVAFVNSLAQLFFFPANPWWALTMFAVDLVVIYALVAYGGKQLRRA